MRQSLLANNIWTLRTAFGETQLDLALALGLNSSNTISNYESGSRKPNNKIKLLFCKWVVIVRLFTVFRAHCISISHFFWRQNCHFNKF